MKKILFGLPALAAFGLLLGCPLRARNEVKLETLNVDILTKKNI